MSNTPDQFTPGGFRPKLSWRVLGTAAPVFPGFEIDICDRVPDHEKQDAVWHRQRARDILRDHPEIKELFGHHPTTAIWCVLFAAAHIGLAVGSAWMPWWGCVLAAYVLGSYFNICLFNLAHDCNHGLVFNNRRWDRWLFTLTSLPMFMPGHHTWWIEHHVHHNDLGAKKDFVKRRRSILLAFKDNVFGRTVPEKWRPLISWITTPLFWPIAILMLTTQVMRSLVGLIVYAATDLLRGRWQPSDRTLNLLADQHLISGYEKYGIRLWGVTYPLINLSMLAAMVWFLGWQPIVYLSFSALFMTGFLHPLMFGLILSNSHFHGHRTYQPSSSYYGWLNRIMFNFGLHTEHHDLEAVPWGKLGRLREIAPEYYDDLVKTKSYAGLALQFAFGRRDDFDNEEHRNQQMFANAG